MNILFKYNENVKFLNMNIYLNANYFNFLQKACKTGIPLLSDKSQTIEKKDLMTSIENANNYSMNHINSPFEVFIETTIKAEYGPRPEPTDPTPTKSSYLEYSLSLLLGLKLLLL